MERFIINRYGPRMSYDDVYALDDFDQDGNRMVEVVDDEHIMINNIYRRHHLAEGDTVYFRKRSGLPDTPKSEWGVYSMTPSTVTEVIDEFTYVLTVPGYMKEYHIVFAEVTSNTITLDEEFCYLPEDFQVVGELTATLDRGVKTEDDTVVSDTVTLGRFYPVYRHNPEYDPENFDEEYNREFINTVTYGLDKDSCSLRDDLLPTISKYRYEESYNYICIPDTFPGGDLLLDGCNNFVNAEFISGLGGTEYEEVPEDIEIDDSYPELIYTSSIVERCYHGDTFVMTAYTYYVKVEDYVFDYDALAVMPLRFDISNYYYDAGDEYDDKTILRLFDSTDIVRSLMYYEIQTNLQESEEYNLLQQNTISDLFADEIKSKVIPDFIDMEKYMFEPAMDGSGTKMASELIFNLHFRERGMHYEKIEEPTPEVFKLAEDGDIEEASINTPEYVMYEHEYYKRVYDDSWSTNDETGWNNSDIAPSAVTKSDLIGVLNFNNDDVRYQKMKLKKSFIRLSFYDSDNPLTQQLLYYSTIFLDSGELFGKFIRNRSTTEGKYSGVFTESDDEEKRLSTRITVKDKYNTEKSSEGFYLYLFGSEFSKTGEPKPVYMKVEFNHAGYGRTLPFTKPYLNEDESEIDENGIPFNKYFSSLYIKLGAKYKPYGDCNYIYYVDDDDTNAIVKDDKDRTISFNLFEVKIA